MTLIEQRIRDFLALRRPPQHLKDDATKEALTMQIVKLVAGNAPDTGLDQWIGQVCEKALIKHKGNGWPSPDVWAEVSNTRRAQPHAQDEPRRIRSLRIFADRITGKQPVGEHYLLGWMADEALRSGMIGFAQLREYQRAAFVARRNAYGTDKAFAWADKVAPALAADMRRADNEAEAAVRQPYADGDEVDGVQL